MFIVVTVHLENSLFEKNLLASLERLLALSGTSLRAVKKLGVAVSGGADSVCLLLALSELLGAGAGVQQQDGVPARGGVLEPQGVGTSGGLADALPELVCVTVDHSIRENDAGAHDAAFVQDLCGKLGIRCVTKKIPDGAVFAEAKKSRRGIEDAARHLRYNAFEDFARENAVQFICLAHNQNDALETILMRFLQGSSSAGLQGMSEARGMYLRPLLKTSRAQIEGYLKSKNAEWKTDATNLENKYLRNKIRNLLVPFLDENFSHWQGAVLQFAEKARYENEAVLRFLPAESGANETGEAGGKGEGFFRDGECIVFEAGAFSKLPIAARQRLLYRAFSALYESAEARGDLSSPSRVPYGFARTLSLWPEADFGKADAAGIEAVSKKEKLFLKIFKKVATENGFFDIIKEEGFFDFDGFSIDARKSAFSVLLDGKTVFQMNAPVPFVVRSRADGDEIQLSVGKKSVSDVFSDWKIEGSQRKKIPLVVNDKNEVLAVLGCVCGFENKVSAKLN